MKSSLRLRRSACAFIVFAFWCCVGVQAAQIVSRSGATLESDGVFYSDGVLSTSDGRRLPVDDAATIYFIAPRPDAAASRTNAPAGSAAPDFKDWVARARRLADQYPGVGGVQILDIGEDILKPDGGRVFRYHFLGLVLNEEKRNDWRRLRAGFQDGRSAARFVLARSIAPDGTVFELDPETLTVSTPSERDGFINKRARVLSGEIPGVTVGSLVEFIREWEQFAPEMPRMYCPSWAFQTDIPVVVSQLTVDIPDPLTDLYDGLAMQWLTLNIPDGAAGPLIENKDGRARYVWRRSKSVV